MTLAGDLAVAVDAVAVVVACDIVVVVECNSAGKRVAVVGVCADRLAEVAPTAHRAVHQNPARISAMELVDVAMARITAAKTVTE
jgi:uncharacterized protein (UPF0261 family)